MDQENITRQSQTTAARDASRGIEKPEKRAAHSGDREFFEQPLERVLPQQRELQRQPIEVAPGVLR